MHALRLPAPRTVEWVVWRATVRDVVNPKAKPGLTMFTVHMIYTLHDYVIHGIKVRGIVLLYAIRGTYSFAELSSRERLINLIGNKENNFKNSQYSEISAMVYWAVDYNYNYNEYILLWLF